MVIPLRLQRDMLSEKLTKITNRLLNKYENKKSSQTRASDLPYKSMT